MKAWPTPTRFGRFNAVAENSRENEAVRRDTSVPRIRSNSEPRKATWFSRNGEEFAAAEPFVAYLVVLCFCFGKFPILAQIFITVVVVVTVIVSCFVSPDGFGDFAGFDDYPEADH